MNKATILTTTYRPRTATPGELAKAGVEIIAASTFGLRCRKCGGVWSPDILRGGRLPQHYWRCLCCGCR